MSSKIESVVQLLNTELEKQYGSSIIAVAPPVQSKFPDIISVFVGPANTVLNRLVITMAVDQLRFWAKDEITSELSISERRWDYALADSGVFAKLASDIGIVCKMDRADNQAVC